MKKKIALLLAAVMTVGSLPMTAFASTTNTVSSIKTVEDGKEIRASLFLSDFKGIGSTEKKQTIKLTLNNAKFKDEQKNAESELTTDQDSAADAEKQEQIDALTEEINTLTTEIADLNDQIAAEKEKLIGENTKTEQQAVETAKAAQTLAETKVAEAETKVTEAKAAEELAQIDADAKAADLKEAQADVVTEVNALVAAATEGGGTLKYVHTTSTEVTGIAGNFTDFADLTDDSDGITETELQKEDGAFTYTPTASESVDTTAANDAVKAYRTAVKDDTAAKTALSTAKGDTSKAEEALTTAKSALKSATDNVAAKEEALKTAEDSVLSGLDEDEKETLTSLEKTLGEKETRKTAAEKELEALQKGSSGVSTFAVTDDSTPAVVTGQVKYTKISDTEYMAEFDAADDYTAELYLIAEADGSGDATVTIESIDSVVSSQTLKIANIADGATTTTISGTTSIKEKGSTIKNVVITETTAGSIEEGWMKLRLTNGFEFKSTPTKDDIVVFPANKGLSVDDVKIDPDSDKQDLLIHFVGESTTAATISIGNLEIGYDEDEVEVGDECEITVSDAGTSRQSIVVGKASDYTVSFTAEDKDLPTFYAGTYSEDTETLVVTLKEELEDAWITGRSTKIVFPEGVEVVEVNVEDKGNTTAEDGATNTAASANISIDENEVDLGKVEVTDKKKAELELSFTLSVSPDFTGDIEATLTGSGIGDDQTVVVGTAAAPVTVDADINELKIDYRNTEASDIVITEADAGVLKKGTTVALAIDGIAFDGDPTVEVESGDMKIENVKIKDDLLTFDIKTESQKEAAVIRVSDVNLYMSRSLPAGEYDLLFVTNDLEATTDIDSESDLSDNAIIRNYSDTKDVEQGTFDVDEITALKGYVTVVTAGRDQDDSTFTTKVTVTIGSDTMYAGTTEIKLDVPAYISNGYTMMPVRAVTEALSGSAIVRWDDPTKTVTITFGQRVISMTVGSNVMKINGVDVAMQAQCEITGERAFIPLRDLGYALGLNDSKIGWDDATKTATLN